jgi:hypothetical protein
MADGIFEDVKKREMATVVPGYWHKLGTRLTLRATVIIIII